MIRASETEIEIKINELTTAEFTEASRGSE